MSLTHVCRWNGTSWERISAQQAKKMYPYSVPANEHVFMCELCGQYVNFVNASYQEAHFRHGHNEDKDCEDRSQIYAYNQAFLNQKHSLPVRINIISGDCFELEIGFISVPIDIIKGKKYKLVITSEQEKLLYSSERIIENSITYLPASKNPAKEYEIAVMPPIQGIDRFWPVTVEALDDEGALFDKGTRKKIPLDADVVVNHKYYLVTKYKIISYPDIEIFRICTMKRKEFGFWYIYEIKAKRLSKWSANFFLQNHCRLTDTPVKMQPLWPPYIKAPYSIYHFGKPLYMFFDGNAELKTEPDRERITAVAGKHLYPITYNGDYQLISAARMQVLKYYYLYNNSASEKLEYNKSLITDVNGNNVDSGEYYKLPSNQRLSVKLAVDGKIERFDKSCLAERITVKANDRIEIDKIRFNTSLKVYEGLDLIYSLSYIKKGRANDLDEKSLLVRWDNCKMDWMPIPHSMSRIMGEVYSCKELYSRVYHRVRKGRIRRDEFEILKKFL